jgi:hypothetical protein
MSTSLYDSKSDSIFSSTFCARVFLQIGTRAAVDAVCARELAAGNPSSYKFPIILFSTIILISPF